MDVMLVWDAFRNIAGLTEEEAKPWLPLCHWAIASVFGRLRPNVDLAENQTVLCHAAAAMAYYKYVLRQTAQNNGADFSVGDVTIKEHAAESLKAAQGLYELSVGAIAHLYEDGFAFMEVPS